MSSCQKTRSAHGYHFAGTVNIPKMERVCALLQALSTTMSPKIAPDSPIAQLARYLWASTSLESQNCFSGAAQEDITQR